MALRAKKLCVATETLDTHGSPHARARPRGLSISALTAQGGRVSAKPVSPGLWDTEGRRRQGSWGDVTGGAAPLRQKYPLTNVVAAPDLLFSYLGLEGSAIPVIKDINPGLKVTFSFS